MSSHHQEQVDIANQKDDIKLKWPWPPGEDKLKR